jgi:hypothetical protein
VTDGQRIKIVVDSADGEAENEGPLMEKLNEPD